MNKNKTVMSIELLRDTKKNSYYTENCYINILDMGEKLQAIAILSETLHNLTRNLIK